jgi:hypothetical protein
LSEPRKSPTLLQTLWSTLGAFFGVQGSATRKRDFTHGKPLHFIAMGLLVTAAFVFAVILFVRLALRQAGM